MDSQTYMTITARLEHYDEIARRIPPRELRPTYRERLNALLRKQSINVEIAMAEARKSHA